MMYDKKEMKIVSFEKAKALMMEGTAVYMVALDGALELITADTDWKKILFHNMKQGSYAVYRKKFTGIGEFSKDIHIGKRKFTIEHSKEEGGGALWKFASCRENQ